jgi:hypothetical protein
MHGMSSIWLPCDGSDGWFDWVITALLVCTWCSLVHVYQARNLLYATTSLHRSSQIPITLCRHHLTLANPNPRQNLLKTTGEKNLASPMRTVGLPR